MKRGIILIMALGLLFDTGFVSYASARVNQAAREKEELENELKNAAEESDDLQSGLDETRQAIESLTGRKQDVEGYVLKLDEELNDITGNLEELSVRIKDKEEEIKETKQELKRAEKDEEVQYDSMKKRIKFMYENGNSSYIELILNSESISDLLNRAFYVTKIAQYDRDMLVRLQETKDYIEETKQRLENEYEQLEALKEEAEVKQSEVEGLIDKKSAEIARYERDILSAKELEADYEADIKAQNAVIAALEASVADKKAEIKRLQEEAAAGGTSPVPGGNMTTAYDGGTFIWPCPASRTISSEYGNRLHPILKVNKFHNGLDIAAPSGSSILAAYNGTVVGASYNASMGNYVMIDHGDGLYTVYMHASALYVSEGQNVNKGDTIAAVGSTGRSTGPHLHFSVRLNGNYVNPHNYVG